jgi:hypothetical protein
VARRTRRSGYLRRAESRRTIGAIGLLAGTIALAAKAASGTFSASVTPTHATDTGALTLTLADGDGDQGHGLVYDLYPGLAQQRLVTVTVGNVGFVSMSLTTSDNCGPCTNETRTTDGTHGLDLKIERGRDGGGASTAWTYSSGSNPNETYTCANPVTVYETTTTAIVGPKDLTAGSILTAGSVNYYRFTYTLAATSPSSAQGAVSVLRHTWSGVQRSATSK